MAGAAIAGPVGRFAGGFVGKQIARGLFSGGKDKIPNVRVVNAAPPPYTEAAGNGPSPGRRRLNPRES